MSSDGPKHRHVLVHRDNGEAYVTTIISQEDHNRAIASELDYLRATLTFVEHRIERLEMIAGTPLPRAGAVTPVP